MKIDVETLSAKGSQVVSDYMADRHARLYYVVRGAFFVDVAFEKRRVAAGRMFFVRAGLVHQGSFGAGGGEVLVVGIPRQSWRKLARRPFDFGVLSPSPLLRELALAQRSAWHRTVAMPLAESLLRLLLNTLEEQCRPPAGQLRPLEHCLSDGLDRRLSLAIRAILTASDTVKLGVPELARKAGLSERQLHRLMVKALGMSPLQALRQGRIERAVARLRTSDDNITEIAYATGFSSLAQFNATFKSVVGCAPTTFRRNRS